MKQTLSGLIPTKASSSPLRYSYCLSWDYPAHYKNSDINNAFVVELFDFISDNQPNYWVYGHHHSNTQPFKIGETEMLTNQLGYVRQNEHWNFLRDICFEV